MLSLTAMGVLSNANSLMFYGAWSRKRLAELLPTDYAPPGNVGAESDGMFLSTNGGG